MGNKVAADKGAQAAIGDIVNSTNITSLIGQNFGNNTVVIHHLHVYLYPVRCEDQEKQQGK